LENKVFDQRPPLLAVPPTCCHLGIRGGHGVATCPCPIETDGEFCCSGISSAADLPILVDAQSQILIRFEQLTRGLCNSEAWAGPKQGATANHRTAHKEVN
jgi:hypothetical protein